MEETEEIELKKEAILKSLKKELVNIHEQMSSETIKNASKDELIRYLELMDAIKEMLKII